VLIRAIVLGWTPAPRAMSAAVAQSRSDAGSITAPSIFVAGGSWEVSFFIINFMVMFGCVCKGRANASQGCFDRVRYCAQSLFPIFLFYLNIGEFISFI
jgi:hypothetical protein